MARVEATIHGVASLAWSTLLVATLGCSTLSSLGLPVSGPHQLMPITDSFRHAAGDPAPFPRELAKGVIPEYLVEPGDVLIVEPNDFDFQVRLPSDQPVQPDGTIELGRFGRLSVAGKSVPQIEAEVRQLIAQQLAEAVPPDENLALADTPPSNRLVSVRLLNRESKVFYVIGEVNSPGSYPLVGRETILDAIMTAGGLTDRANEHKLVYVRPTAPDDCRLVLPICYRQIVQLGDTSTNYQVMPGDRIYVPSMTLCEDVIQFLHFGTELPCPRCKALQQPCLSSPECPGCSGCPPTSS